MTTDPLINIMGDYEIIKERLENHFYSDGHYFRISCCFPFLKVQKPKSAK